jgi:hypothetical protein
MSRVTCRGTRTRGVGEVVDDERRDESCDEPRDVRGTRTRSVLEVVNDEPRGEPRRAEAPRRAA